MRSKLAETIGNVFWSDLSAHVARDAVIVVAEELDLLDVGEAVAQNDVRTVGAWIDQGRLTKPTAEELVRWPLVPGARFTSLIVAPFVFIRRPAAERPS